MEYTSRDLSLPRVLIVEDNLINQKVAARMVARLGYRVDVVENGAEAVEAVSRVAYAAVLMDCEMPEMDGYEATRQIRQAEPLGRQVPIIALTARVQPEDRERGLAVGMNEYLAKPICAYALAVALERWGQAVAC